MPLYLFCSLSIIDWDAYMYRRMCKKISIDVSSSEILVGVYLGLTDHVFKSGRILLIVNWLEVKNA